MTNEAVSFEDIVAAYARIPGKIAGALERVDADKIDVRNKRSEMSLRETVHHLVEANIVAASMMIAALGAAKATYDWSWLWPGRDWCDRMHYDAVPLEAAVATLNGLIQHVVNIVRVRDDAASRKVSVHDTPGAEPYFLTVAQILDKETKHVDEHLGEIMPEL